MKAIMVMFDTLNRHFLSPYGCDWTYTPNFQRLAEHSVVFDNNYVGSLPCIPARRELHTGRYNFLHRSWGPLEPFDESMPAMLTSANIYTHLATDHLHYFEEGGGTYHEKYNTWYLARGQEGDALYPDVKMMRENSGLERYKKQDRINRQQINTEEKMSITKTFENGLDFLKKNFHEDNWFLTVEAFDPHEPYFVPQKYKDYYQELYGGDWPDWPEADLQQAKECRYAYAALVSMCDYNLGKILDFMEEHQLWEDTMLILNTDHGFLLGEHGGIGKVPLPGYREVCNTPLMIWDPRSRTIGRNAQLVQTIDLAPTLLDYFQVKKPEAMLGKSLLPTIADNSPVREAALFGVHSLYTCCTDGHYLYMKAPIPNTPVYNYTLMPTHMHSFFLHSELETAELVAPFSFTKGLRLMRCETGEWSDFKLPTEDLLFDLVNDPQQLSPLKDKAIAQQMLEKMKQLMDENDAPAEYYQRVGISR